jgi:hypothetical protein
VVKNPSAFIERFFVENGGLVENYAKMALLRINCDVIQFFLAFFMLLRNNPPPLVVPNGLSRLCTVLIPI